MNLSGELQPCGDAPVVGGLLMGRSAVLSGNIYCSKYHFLNNSTKTDLNVKEKTFYYDINNDAIK